MSDLDPRQFDLRRLRQEAVAIDDGSCPNGPDEYGNWPCDPCVYGFEAPWPSRPSAPDGAA